MKTAVITVAGISSRFNEGVPEKERVLKAIYHEGDARETLLYHLLRKCVFADRIVVVGGYRFAELETYVCSVPEEALRRKLRLVENPHYSDLNSGYSLYLGLREALTEEPEEILFVEGDLDIDAASFEAVIRAEKTVLSYNYEPIRANKAVVLYADGEGRYHYAFNSSHGLLKIEDAFAAILNSGQLWKFHRPELLAGANERFGRETPDGTNLRIIQNYLDCLPAGEVELIGLDRWTNCNTREDYRHICQYWRNKE